MSPARISRVTGVALAAYVRDMSTAAALQHTHVEDFRAHDRAYRWTEGNGALDRTVRHSLRRDQLREVFARVLVPGMERRAATRASYVAGRAGDGLGADVRWVAWSAPGDGAVVWGLYAATRRL